jgi:hypothetical protein
MILGYGDQFPVLWVDALGYIGFSFGDMHPSSSVLNREDRIPGL